MTSEAKTTLELFIGTALILALVSSVAFSSYRAAVPLRRANLVLTALSAVLGLVPVLWTGFLIHLWALGSETWWKIGLVDAAYLTLLLVAGLAEAYCAGTSFWGGFTVVLSSEGMAFCATLVLCIPLVLLLLILGVCLTAILIPLPTVFVPLYALIRWARIFPKQVAGA